MPPDQDVQDLIKRVTEATVKAVAARDNVTVSFAPGAHGITQTEDGTQARLPTPVRVFGKDDLSVLRGEADAVALRLRYNDVKTYHRQRPIGKQQSDRNSISQGCTDGTAAGCVNKHHAASVSSAGRMSRHPPRNTTPHKTNAPPNIPIQCVHRPARNSPV